MSVLALVNDRFRFGWYFPEAGRLLLDDDLELGSYWPVSYDGDEPVYDRFAPANGKQTIVCPRCMEPASHVTRHAVEKHGDTDVEILPPVHADHRPDWFQSDWI